MPAEHNRATRHVLLAFAAACELGVGSPAFAWDDDGHNTIALIARRYTEQATREWQLADIEINGRDLRYPFDLGDQEGGDFRLRTGGL